MALDPHAKRLLRMASVTGGPAASATGIRARREAFSGLMRLSGRPVAISSADDGRIPGPGGDIGIRVYTPLDTAAELLPGLVFFHGGGLVAGSLDTHDPLCRMLANAAMCRVIAVDYRLAPEHKFPAALIDARTAFGWIYEHAAEYELDRERIGVAGDSAGGAIAIAVCALARESGWKMPALQLLLCPITDFAAETDSRSAFATGYLIDRKTIEQDLRHYLPPDTLPVEPLVSPLRLAEFRGLPPAFIHTAEFDPFGDEGDAYSRRLADEGVTVVHTCHPGMIHLFYAMSGVIPYSRLAIAQMGAEVRAAFDR